MKYLGYMKEFDPNLVFSKSLNEYRSNHIIEKIEFNNILKYLKGGHLAWTWMEFWEDDQGKPIDGASYFCDGEWVWPLYFTYYLEKYSDLKIDTDFLNHIKQRNWEVKDITREELITFENQYFKNLKKYSILK